MTKIELTRPDGTKVVVQTKDIVTYRFNDLNQVELITRHGPIVVIENLYFIDSLYNLE